MAAPVRTPRTAWVDAGLEALAAGGPDAVRVELLAAALGVTKGGFYGHFRDRASFLEEMLDEWERSGIDEVIERVEETGGDARHRLRRLFELASTARDLRSIELAVRDWARREANVAARVRRVDNRRIDYLRSLFGELCVGEDDVEARCLLTMALFTGSAFVAADHGTRSRADVVASALALLQA